MKLTLWTYEGPPHVGAMRVATAMEGLHYVLHAPQGDTYADLLFTMIERQSKRPPVTYTTFQARDLGGDTAELFKNAALEAYERFKPQALLVGASCTAELIQDDPGGLARALGLPIPVVAVELPAYQKKENWGSRRDFLPVGPGLRGAAPRRRQGALQHPWSHRAGFPPPRRRRRNRSACCDRLGVAVNVVAPLGRNTGRSGPAGRRRVQHRAVSGNRDAGGILAVTPVRPANGQDRADRRRRHPRFHCRSGCIGRCRSVAAKPTTPGCLGIRGRSTRPT